jgi:hypothetical protein
MAEVSSPPGGEPRVPREPNQYNTPCYVIFQLGEIRSRRQHFDDLQMAYLWAKEMKELYESDRNERWTMISWTRTIRRLYEYHMEDRSGLEVATGPGKCVIIYYDI